ncbi:hypothetical protein [Micromonospora aurantiaca (nom. illeg.)]|uniref:hypothetical protein n=1 Tax=Micromonospora aurantiaca (nom. illeg.) TaxID=47850 RepID=UPI003EBF5E2C
MITFIDGGAPVGFLRMRGTLVALTATALASTTAASAPADDLSTPASSSTFPPADPDTLPAKDGSYVTSTVGAGTGARCGATGPTTRLLTICFDSVTLS